jgi:hypothetical protein
MATISARARLLSRIEVEARAYRNADAMTRIHRPESNTLTHRLRSDPGPVHPSGWIIG